MTRAIYLAEVVGRPVYEWAVRTWIQPRWAPPDAPQEVRFHRIKAHSPKDALGAALEAAFPEDDGNLCDEAAVAETAGVNGEVYRVELVARVEEGPGYRVVHSGSGWHQQGAAAADYRPEASP